MSPASAGFAGGLVVGYFLHVWEKMVTYERMLEERVSARRKDRFRRRLTSRLET